jgi:DNA repair ATPase RecN
MADQAKVTSIDALEAFRASLIVFLTRARRALDDSSEDVRRTRQWVQHDQRQHWENELRRRIKKLEQARQELMSARLAVQQSSAVAVRQLAVAKAEREIAEVEAKLGKLKGWAQNFDSRADPLLKRVDGLRLKLADLNKAASHLVNLQKTLEAYAESGASLPAPAPLPAAEAETETEPHA